MKELKRICWDCPGEPVETWEIKKIKIEEKVVYLLLHVNNARKSRKFLAG